MTKAERLARLAVYDALFISQGGVCAICSRPPRKRRLAMDHNHKSGRTRGLLCAYCNHYMVGRHTDWRLLKKVSDYLRAYANQPD